MCASKTNSSVQLDKIHAFIFDLDGVLTETEKQHSKAWKRMFDEYLKKRSKKEGTKFKPFTDSDYKNYVDGKPRYDGVRDFLKSRKITIPEGKEDDSPKRETICGLGNRKDNYFHEILKREGAEVYKSSINFIRDLRERDVKTAVISSSKNCGRILKATHIQNLFDKKVDGNDLDRLKMPGKPDPAMFLEAAKRLKVEPKETAIVEDSLAGVEAGRSGKFALVVGMAHGGDNAKLKEHGADIAVGDLQKLISSTIARKTNKSESSHNDASLPSALNNKKIEKLLNSKDPAVFLDYDGTLTEIVDDPSKAFLSKETRETLKELSSLCKVTILSGRDVEDVRKLVKVNGIIYAGSHGFDIIMADGKRQNNPKWLAYLPSIERAKKRFRAEMKGIPGVKIENKRVGVSVHYRNVKKDSQVKEVKELFDKVASSYPKLRKTTGKKVLGVLPNVKWNKGTALEYLLDDVLPHDNPNGVAAKFLPVFIGDDVTDEDAFRAIQNYGVGILVVDKTSGDDNNNDRDNTLARYTLRDPRQVRTFLQNLVKILRRERRKESIIKPWSLDYIGYDPSKEKLREALCTTGNGYFATRGAAPESKARRNHYPGTYVAGCYNRLQSKIKGHKLEHESIVNVPNWLPLTFKIGSRGRWFDLDDDHLEILEYRQNLDLRSGILTRKVRVKDSRGRITRIVQRRFVHMEFPHLAGLETTILAENWKGRLTILSALDGTVKNNGIERYNELNSQHLEEDEQSILEENRLLFLTVKTTQSKIRISETSRTRVMHKGKSINSKANIVRPMYVGQKFTLSLRSTGESVSIEKIVALYTSKDLAISECGLASKQAALNAPSFSKLVERQTLSWEHLWRRFRIEIEGDEHAVLEAHVHAFHLLETLSHNSIDRDAGVPPRGLSGEAYRGHILWDELFIFHFLNLHIPDLTRSLLMYRYRRLDWAKRAALQVGLRGAMYPWQSGSNGREESQVIHLNPVSKRWISDNSHLQRHVGLAIAYNVWTYYQISRDLDFLSFYGLEMMIEISRFFVSLAKYSRTKGRYEIKGVMGPDEFHDAYPGSEKPGLNNNAYTNVMVVWLLCRTLEALDLIGEGRRQTLLERIGLREQELLSWEDISRKMFVPFHDGGVISQFEGYGKLKEFDWEGYKQKYGNIQRLDRILESEGDSPNNYKLSKQADVLMLFFLLSSDELKETFARLGYRFARNAFEKNIQYYLKRTSHGSTLSRVVHSWVVARVDREESWQVCKEALEGDLSDIQGGTTAEGIHLGAMAGSLNIFQRCYTGLLVRKDALWLDPVLPEELKRLRFSLSYREHRLNFNVTPRVLELKSTRKRVAPIRVRLPGRSFELKAGASAKIFLAPKTRRLRKRASEGRREIKKNLRRHLRQRA